MLAAIIALLFFFALLVITTYVSIRHNRKLARGRLRERQEARQLALELNPLYQEKIAADRAHQLALRKCALAEQKQTVELAVMRERFELERYVSLHRIADGHYSINEAITTVTAFPKPTPTQKVIAPQTPLQVPSPFDLLSIFQTAEISPERIFLGKDSKGNPIYCSAGKLYHVAFNAATGRGKTILERGILTQLLFIGHQVILCDLKFALITEENLDYRPIVKRLYNQEPINIAPGVQLSGLVTNEADIASLLHWAAYPEIARRLSLRRRGDYSYKTLDIFIEELLAFIKAYPQAADDIIRIIALGRELRMNVFTAAQNFLVKDINMSGGSRENFITAYFLGGDMLSGCKILDMGVKDLNDFLQTNNVQLGRGLGMLRNEYIMPNPSLVILGTASNEAVYYLLGRADDFTLPEEPAYQNQSLIVLHTVPQDSTEERAGATIKNGEEPDTEPVGTVFTGVLDTIEQDENAPFILFTQEQRTAILAAAKEPDISLKKIRERAKFGNDSKRWAALKLWLAMNGYTIQAKPLATEQKEVRV